jgi:predicted RNA-binding protein with PUA-like domain
MNYWLVKSEPSVYSWDQFVKDKKTAWEGVRNFAARNNLRAMKKGDRVLYYHSNEGLAVVGVAEVAKESYQDPTTDDPNWVVVDLKPLKALAKPVTLAQMKSDADFADMALIRIGRLSVSPVSNHQFNKIINMGGINL